MTVVYVLQPQSKLRISANRLQVLQIHPADTHSQSPRWVEDIVS